MSLKPPKTHSKNTPIAQPTTRMARGVGMDNIDANNATILPPMKVSNTRIH